MTKTEDNSINIKISLEFAIDAEICCCWMVEEEGKEAIWRTWLALKSTNTPKPMLFLGMSSTILDPPSHKPLPLNHAQFGAYFLLLKLLLWLFVRDEGEIFGKAERLEAPDDLQKIKNIMD